MFFSCSPLPVPPGSLPPWPGSITMVRVWADAAGTAAHSATRIEERPDHRVTSRRAIQMPPASSSNAISRPSGEKPGRRSTRPSLAVST